ncbi:MAG: sensor histidine kinase [Gammaproteobacteria bacterium]|nr:MAG: sensor histidine kinase [Gammaproteobacteria bacterium]
MRSIRLYLLLSLIATITLVNFVSLLHGYQSSMEQAQQLFDSRLQSMAKLIAAANHDQTERAPLPQQQTPYVFFQIWDHNKKLIIRSSNAPSLSLSVLTPGFHDVNYESYRWRNFIFHDELSQRWIVTAERSDIRYSLAEQVVLKSISPIILGIPVAAFIIWWAISLGLRPLRNLTEQLKLKQANDLSPIIIEHTPTELIQVVQTTNALFSRLDDAFQREHQFSTDVAHELRTPVSVLKVHLHNLQTTFGDNNEELNLLRQGVNRMGHLIEQILALYRAAPDQAMSKFCTIDLYSLAQNSIATNYGLFEEKQQTIELTGEPSPMAGDQFALETLLHNLLSNSCKYTPVGGQIVISVESSTAGVNLTIEDSGVGIPSNQYVRVFERFYRLYDDQYNSETIGCGLGLAIVKHIVELHHAFIELGQSKFKSGLKVTINFPIEANQPW